MITKNSYSMYGLDQIQGLSTDSKPTDVPENSIFLELDTNKFYYFANGGWAEVGTEAPAPPVHYSVTIHPNEWSVEADFGYIEFVDNTKSAGLVAGESYVVFLGEDSATVTASKQGNRILLMVGESVDIYDEGDSMTIRVNGMTSALSEDMTVTIDSSSGD